MNKLSTHSLVYGLGAALIVIVYSLLIYLGGLTEHSWLNNVSYLFYIAIAVVGIKNWRDKVKGGTLTYGQALGYLTTTALFYSLAMAVWTFVFFSYIAPDLMEQQLMKQEAQMEAKGMAPEMIEMSMKYARMFTQPAVMVVFVLLIGMLILTVINLIIAAIMKKDPPPFGGNFVDPNGFPNPNMPFPNQNPAFPTTNAPFPPVNNPSQNTPNQPPLPPTTPPYPPTT